VYSLLAERGFDVLCGARNPIKARRTAPGRTFCHFDLDEARSVENALAGVQSAIYLVHSMAEQGDFEARERRNAHAFRDLAACSAVERIVYLGGMLPRGRLSRHLASRLETGKTLRAGKVPAIELQATMIVGGGSESFRIVRDLAARLPFMLLPRWLKSRSEPVAIGDVAEAITHALTMPLTEQRVYTVPGPASMSGREIILRTARALGQDPKVVNVPFVTPRLSSYWIRLVTRANPQVATALVEGLRSNIVSKGPEIWDLMPEYRRTPYDEAVRSALREEAKELPQRARLLERILHAVTRTTSTSAPR
jgi:uncharacterized protein YbjT (DUF2867 family)